MSTAPASPTDAPPSRLRLAAVASLLAALALTFALVSPTFWSGVDGSFHYSVGLVRVELCGEGMGCRAGWTDSFAGGASSWTHVGLAALAAGSVAAFIQVLLGIGALRGGAGRLYRPRLGVGTALFAFSLAAVYVVAAPDGLPAPGAALIAFFGGAAVATAASAFLHPRRRG